MARALVRQIGSVTTGFVLTATMLFGLGLWRRSEDAKWCRQAAAGGVVAGDPPLNSNLLDEVRSACTLQRERQRVVFGAVWRRDGRETAHCGFELARLQLISDQDRNAYRAALRRYGLDDGDFDTSNREHQSRFVKACLSSGQHKAS